MAEPDEQDELQEPTVTDVPEPDQPSDDETSEEEAAEAEQGAQEPTEAPEAQGTTPEEWEKRFQKAERAFASYTKKVTEIYADEATLLTPFSISPSAPPGFVYGPDAGRVPEDVQRLTFEFFGLAREQDYEADPEAHECRTYKGKGKTSTGSHVGGNESRSCPTCLG